jgi:two-component system sensor histidine kinase YesM
MIRTLTLDRSGDFLVYDRTGNVIYHENPDLWGKPMNDSFPDLSVRKGKHAEINGAKDGDHLLVYNRLDFADWQIVNRIPMDDLVGDLAQLNSLTVAIGAVLVFLALMVMCTILFVMTRALKSLQRLMKKAEIGDLEARAPENHSAIEISSLYRSYNSMVDEIRRLVEVVHRAELKEKELELRQMESRLMLMQSQINPHFLYNSLEVVNSYAIEAGVKEVSRMAVAIAKMFRYNMRDMKSQVPLSEEFEHLRTYLSIQQERFANMEYELDLDKGELAKATTIRLALQPIVENCFKHGYDKQAGRKMWIGISGRVEGNRYTVTVSDRGTGMDQETVTRLNASFAEVKLEQAAYDFRLAEDQQVGMWNVHSRIRLTFGAEYGMHIAQSDDTGTSIELYFPWGEQG